MFKVALTSPWYPSLSDGYDAALDPNSTGWSMYGPYWISNFSDCNVNIGINEQRTASVNFPFRDPGYKAADYDWGVQEFSMFLAVWYYNDLVHWGPLVGPTWDFSTGIFTANSIDETVRLQHQYFRYGDIIDHPNPTGHRWQASVDGDGLELMRKAGDNVGSQITHDPPLGLILGTDTSDAHPTTRLTIARGDPVWSAMQDLCNHSIGPDMEFRPVWGVPGTYAYMNVFQTQMNNTTDFSGNPTNITARFAYNCEDDSLDAYSISGSGNLITMAHVLSTNGYRITVQNSSDAQIFGDYIYWDATEYASDTNGILEERGKALVQGYSRPLNVVSLGIKPDCQYRYLRDFDMGDVIMHMAKKDGYHYSAQDRIVNIRLVQQGDTQNIRTELELQAFRNGTASTTNVS
jgi:hypothetical protein